MRRPILPLAITLALALAACGTTPTPADASAPVVGTLTTVITNGTDVKVEIPATDAVGVTRISYRLTKDGVPGQWVSVPVEGQGSYSVMFGSLAPGEYKVEIVAYDAAGNASATTVKTFTIDAPVTPPPADTTAPSLTVPADLLTKEASVSLTVTATDESGIDAVTYTVAKDEGAAGNPMAATATDAGYSVDLADLTDGVYTVSVTATDKKGNASTARTVKVTVDRTAPALTSENVTVTPSADGTASVAVTGEGSVQYSTDGTTFMPAATSPFTLPVSGTYQPGNYSVWVKVVDAAGNESAPVEVKFTIPTAPDTTKPTVQTPKETVSQEWDAVAGGFPVSATVAFDDNVGVTSVTATLNGNAVAADKIVTAQDGKSAALDLGTLTSGKYTLVVTVADAGNNSASTDSYGFTVADTTKPAVTSLVASSATVVTGKMVTLTAQASDNVGVKDVEFFQDGVSLGMGTLANGVYTLDWTAGSTLGDVHFTAVAHDDAGLASDAFAPATVTVVADQAAPTVTGFTATRNGNSANVDLSATLTDDGAIAKVEYFTSLNAAKVNITSALVGSTLTYKANIAKPSGVPVTVTLVVTDASGKATEMAVTVE
ncbi:Ig-like domain-containing protein [Deinococcus pimensis]|uniref:Ig-like domain-containing protein n=1 Tax=Deinococcus pimensis TaxID=309888 RepID=UPI000485DF2D|nr:Ig-like domain-containing protein [Deinococcus pimensis]